MGKHKPYWQVAFLALLVVFHGVNNWFWLRANEVPIGSDRIRHFLNSVTYDRLLRDLNFGSLFRVITLDDYRPPLFHLSAVLSYRLFGVSPDVGAMVNIAYMAVLLSAIYGLGKKVYGENVGLLAAFAVSTFPMIYALSRYFYVDFALTAMVALNICFLLYTDGFKRRGYALLYGLTLGLGMLVKWTFIAFTLVPFILVIVRSSSLSSLLKAARRLSIDRRWSAYSVVGGILLTLLWYLPAREAASQLALEIWMVPLSWFLIALLIYLLSRPSNQGTNLLSGIVLGIMVAGIWYIPQIGFWREFVIVAWGKARGRFWGFDAYLFSLIYEQLSPLYSGLLLLALLSLVVWRWKALRGARGIKALTSDHAIIASWALVPYLIFSFQASTLHPRYITPLTPALALVIARGILEISFRKVRASVILLTSLISVAQLFALSYDDPGWLRQMAVLDLPGGRVNAFAQGYEIQLPATGATDRGYWIAPQVLELVSEESRGKDGVKLGLLTKTLQIQASTFWYVIAVEGHSAIELQELAKNWEGRPVRPRLFEMDYLLVKDGSQKGLSPESKAAVEMILSGASPFINELFELTEEYPLPDGDTVYLYRKRYHLAGEYNPDDYRALGETVTSLGKKGDGLIITPPEQVEVLGKYVEEKLEPYPLPKEVTSSQELEEELIEILSQHSRILGTFWDEGGIEKVHLVEGGLNEHGYRAWERWYGGLRLVIYASPLGEEKTTFRPLKVRLGEKIILDGYRLIDQKVKTGDILRLMLHWKADDMIEENYKVFLHLLDEEGRLVAQKDGEPGGGMRPTNSWMVDEEILDRYGVLVGEGTLPGRHELVVGIYEPESGERLLILDEDERIIGDKVSLGMVEVVDE